MTELICIVCPKGCRLKIDEKNGLTVTGNACPRGEAYGKKELLHPTRTVTSTVKITGGLHRRLPVKTTGEIPKALVRKAAALLDEVETRSPIAAGTVVLADVLGTGVDFVATRDM